MPFFLETERLLIRSFQPSDLESVFAYRNDPNVARYQGWDIPYPREKALQWVTNPDVIVPTEPGGRFKAALELKSTGEMIGDIGFMLNKHDARQAECGYSLSQTHWHQGYAAEAVKRLLSYLFDDLNLHRVTAVMDVDNLASWRLADRLGFRREAHFVENILFKGSYASEYHYAVLRREWKEQVGNAGNVEAEAGSSGE